MDSRAASRLRAQGIPLSLAALLALSCHAQILHAQACPPYERQSWGDGWADADGDCQNTRQEALIEESKEPVGFKGTGKCKVTTGSWDNPYTGEGHASPERLVVAPLVSLKETHESGGHAWPAARKRLYANMLSDPDHLVVVSAAALESMEGKDPAEWLPGNATDQAAHARIWARIKNTWGLTADQAEHAALRRLLGATAVLPQEMPETRCATVGAGDPRALRNANGVERDPRAWHSEVQQDVNQLRRELWETQSEFLSWWFQAASVFLALITLTVILIGSFGIYRFFRLEKEAREHADEIKRHAFESKAIMEELQGANAQGVSDSPGQFQDIKKTVQSNPQATMLDKALADAISTQQSAKSPNEYKRAEEKWRTVAWLAQEWKNGAVAAQAWFSVGYLIQVKSPEHKRWDPDNVKEAISCFDKVLNIDPNIAEAYSNRGNAKSRLGDHQAAIADHDKALEIDPNLAGAYSNRGNAKSCLGDHQAAIADHDRALEINPKLADAYTNRGNSKSGLGDHQAAIADHDKALEINPKLAEAYSNRGIAKSGLGDHQAAIADHDRALGIDPKLADAYTNRGNAKSDLGDHQAAIADHDKALGINPKLAEAYSDRGVAKSGLGDHQAAIADCNKALEIDPTDAKTYCNRAVANVALGRKNAARSDFRTTLELARKTGRNDLETLAKEKLRDIGNDEDP